ncbi:hypothetical protein FDO65_18880 [Nakamurella flava]|uniref:Uncharacterized protein n=1 Tax=Nakamurella flava TaxID=2576308 RepID=A0A4U6QAF1_9ACTN|nr:hypothetical protein [Nakamurella flava]TKV56906.1 hypothetical protein FDO65_18880 [Nakamurella flava]
MLTTGVDMVAEALDRYGEAATAEWILTCTDDELVRVCAVADWLLSDGPSTATGRSMMIGEACALAAVYVREGSPRQLARSRRGPGIGRVVPPDGGRRPDHRLQASVPGDYGVGRDLRDFWGVPGA